MEKSLGCCQTDIHNARRRLCLNKRRIHCDRNEYNKIPITTCSDAHILSAPTKRSRISGPSYYKDREEDKVSNLEVLAIQLFTLVLAAFNKSEDVDVSWSFQRLTDAICRERENLVAYIELPENNESSPSIVTAHFVNDTGIQNVKLTSNASLKKFNNMIFLLLGNSSRAPGLQQKSLQQTSQQKPLRQKKPPLSSIVNPNPLSSRQQNAIIKHSVHLIDLFLKYNLKRKKIFKKPFEVSGVEMSEYISIVYQVIYQTWDNIQTFFSKRKVLNTSAPSTLTEAVSTIEACTSIYCNFVEIWTISRVILSQDDKIASLLLEIVTGTQQLLIVDAEDAAMTRSFQVLERSALSLLDLLGAPHRDSENHV